LGWARKAIFSFSYVPLDFITWIALVTVAISFVLMLTQFTLRLFYPDLAPRGFTTLILIILFMGGVQLLCLGIIGSYLAHIYDEVKRRPPYIIESFFNYPPQVKNEYKRDL
jgi:dolichol-phosphate mannosyltransferase